MADWLHVAGILGWLLAYGAAVVVAAAQEKLAATRTKRWLLTLVAYAVGVVPAFFWGRSDPVDTALFACTFVALTWLIIFTVKKQQGADANSSSGP